MNIAGSLQPQWLTWNQGARLRCVRYSLLFFTYQKRFDSSSQPYFSLNVVAQAFSIEPGARGMVEVSDVPRNDVHAIVDTFDVQRMRVGEDRLLRRDGNERSVVLYLQTGKAGR